MKNKSSKITILVQCNVHHSMYIEEKSQEDIEQMQRFNEYKKTVVQSTITYVNDAFIIIDN